MTSVDGAYMHGIMEEELFNTSVDGQIVAFNGLNPLFIELALGGMAEGKPALRWVEAYSLI